MSLATDTAVWFRTVWADRLVDTVTITGPTVGGSFNPATLVYDGGSAPSRYSGAALVRPVTGEPREQATQEERSLMPVDVYVPWNTTGVEPDDLVTVSTSLLDPELTGQTLVVRSIEVDSYVTRRRLRCELDLGRGSGRA